MTEKQAPGVMLYFELRRNLRRLNWEQKGALLDAILEYGETGDEPEFEDLVLGIVWDFIRPRIDADRETYAQKVQQRTEASAKRWSKTSGSDADGMRNDATDMRTDATDMRNDPTDMRNDATVSETPVSDSEPIPTTTTTSTTTPSTTSTATPSSTPTSTTSFSSNIFLKTPEPNGSGEKEKIFLKEKNNIFSSEENDVSFKPPTLREVEEYVRERQSPVDPRVFYDFYQSKGWRVGQAPMTDWRASLRAAESWSRWKKPPAAPTRQQTPTRAQTPYSQDDPHVNHVTQEELSDLRAMIEKIKRGGTGGAQSPQG